MTRNQRIAARMAAGESGATIAAEFGLCAQRAYQVRNRELARARARAEFMSRTSTPEDVYVETEVCRGRTDLGEMTRRAAREERRRRATWYGSALPWRDM